MTLSRPAALYLDSNAIISSVEGASGSLSLLIARASRQSVKLVTSELTLAEILVGPLKQSEFALAAFYEDMFSAGKPLSVVPIDRAILRRSAEIRANIGNSGADAIHIATAMASGCAFFISADKRLRLPSGLDRHGIDEIEDLSLWT